MAKHLTHAIPPALPAKLSPPKVRKSTLTDQTHMLLMARYDGDDERSAEARAYANTVDTIDAQTGHPKGDAILLAKILQEDAREKGICPAVQTARLNDIATKLQHCLRRHDTPEQAFSRSARLKALTYQPAETNLDATGAE